MDDGLQGVGRRSALALVGAIVSGVATIATILIASRSLPTTGAGQFFVAISLFAIVQGICSFGAETGLQFFVPTTTPGNARRLIRVISAWSLALGVTVSLIVWAAAGPFGELLARGESGDASATSMVRAVAFVLPAAGLYEVVMGSLRACDRVFVSIVLDRIVRPVVQVVAMLVVAIVGGGAQAAMFAWALPTVAACIAAALMLTRISLRGAARNDVVTTADFWAYTSPRAIARIAQTLTQRLDVIILAAVYPLDEAAVYGTVSRCMIAGVFVATAVRQAVQPQLRRLIVRGEHDSVKAMYGITTTWLVLVTWPAYIAMITHAPLVMSAFGPEYVRGADALVLLCLAMLVASACGLVDVVLLMLGRSWLSTIDTVTALTINIVLNLLLAPQYGMIGSAIAWVVAILVTNLLPLYQTSSVGLHPGGRPLATATSTAALAIGLPLALSRITFGADLLPFAATGVAAVALYCGLLYAVRDRVHLDELVNDLRRPRRAASAGGV